MDATTLGLFLGALVLLMMASLAFTLNGLAAHRLEAEKAWVQIDSQLHLRHAAVLGLVETARPYAAHERKLLDAILGARRSAIEVSSVAERAQAENMLTSALSVLFALSESYPELRANNRFVALRQQLAETEEQLALTAQRFNAVGESFNATLLKPPANLLAATFGFKAMQAFSLRPRAPDQVLTGNSPGL
jgi:LemA protein